MKLFQAALLGSFMVSCGISNVPAYFKTGNELNVWCAAEESDPDYTTLQAFCTAYIQGVADAIETNLSEGSDERSRCVPDGSTAEQLAKIVMEYQANNLTRRHLSASDAVVAALTETFDCKTRFSSGLN